MFLDQDNNYTINCVQEKVRTVITIVMMDISVCFRKVVFIQAI